MIWPKKTGVSGKFVSRPFLKMISACSSDVPCNLDDKKEEDDSEEDLIDPHESLRDCCAQKRECASLKDRLDECNARVESKSKTAETCVEEVIEFIHCIENCAAKSLFLKLK